MRRIGALLVLLCLSGCGRQVLVPEVQVRPNVVGFGSHFSVRLYGAEISDYRFMGALPAPGGGWHVRIDPVYLGLWNQPAQLYVREGDILPLGTNPSVLVQFELIRTSELRLRAVEVYRPHEE